MCLHQVLLLASADAALRRDKQLALPAVRFSASTEVAADAARELHFVELEVSRRLLMGCLAQLLLMQRAHPQPSVWGGLGGSGG